MKLGNNFEGEILRVMGRGDIIVVDDEQPPSIGKMIRVHSRWRKVLAIESTGQRPPWGLVLNNEGIDLVSRSKIDHDRASVDAKDFARDYESESALGNVGRAYLAIQSNNGRLREVLLETLSWLPKDSRGAAKIREALADIELKKNVGNNRPNPVAKGGS